MPNSYQTFPTEELKKHMLAGEDVKFISRRMENPSRRYMMGVNGCSTLQNKLQHYWQGRQLPVIELPENFSLEDAGERLCAENEQLRLFVSSFLRDLENVPLDHRQEVQRVVQRAILNSSFDVDYTPGAQGGENARTVRYVLAEDAGSSGLTSQINGRIAKGLYGPAAVGERERRHITRLLSERGSKSKIHGRQREELVIVAYVLGMSLEEANLLLSRDSFVQKLDFSVPWELKAAYILQCCSLEDQGSYVAFQQHMRNLTRCIDQQQDFALGKQNYSYENFLAFAKLVFFSELRNWLDACLLWRQAGLEQAYLAGEAWRLAVDETPELEKLDFCNLQALHRAEETVSGAYVRLRVFAQQHCAAEEIVLQEDEYELAEWIVKRVENRRGHMHDFLSLLLHNRLNPQEEANTIAITDAALHCSFQFVPPLRPAAWHNFFKDASFQKLADPDSILARSDVIRIGIAFGLGLRGMDYLLQISGFYPLYVKDFHERNLMRALLRLPGDGDGLWVQRNVKLKAEILVELEQACGALDAQSVKMVDARTPEWSLWLRKKGG